MHEEDAIGFENAAGFVEELGGVREVVDHVGGDEEIEAGGAEGEVEGINAGDVEEILPEVIGKEKLFCLDEVGTESGAAADIDASGTGLDIAVHPGVAVLEQPVEIQAFARVVIFSGRDHIAFAAHAVFSVARSVGFLQHADDCTIQQKNDIQVWGQADEYRSMSESLSRLCSRERSEEGD